MSHTWHVTVEIHEFDILGGEVGHADVEDIVEFGNPGEAQQFAAELIQHGKDMTETEMED